VLKRVFTRNSVADPRKTLREILVQSSLKHPAIAPLYGVILSQEHPIFILDYYPNDSLYAFLKARPDVRQP
jgi:serine/threonine protein kinase